MSYATQELHDAIENSDLARVVDLLQKGADVNCRINRQTATTKALAGGQDEIISAILNSRFFDANVGNEFGQSPLHVAVHEGLFDLAVKLLNLGAEVDGVDNEGVTPLGVAAMRGFTPVADLLIRSGADINRSSKTGETPVYQACRGNRLETVQLLVDHGCGVNVSTNHTHNHPGHTPLMAAISAVHFNASTSICDDGISRMLAILVLLTAHDCDINFQDFRGRTALALAVMDNNIPAACLLLNKGCNVNRTDKFGYSPLQRSLQSSQFYLTTVLLLYGAEADLFHQNSETQKLDCLSVVLKTTRTDLSTEAERNAMIDLLVSASNPFHTENFYNRIKLSSEDSSHAIDITSDSTLLDTVLNNRLTLQSCCRYAIRRRIGDGALYKVKALHVANPLKLYLNLGYNVNRFHPMHVIELYVAVEQCDLNWITNIVQNGTSVEAVFCGRRPLTAAADLGRDSVLRLLLSLGADPNAVDMFGESALHLAARNSCTETVETLLSSSVSLELKNNEGRTPLLEAAFSGDNQIFSLLLDAGCDPRTAQKNDISVLHYMAGNGNEAMVRRLLEMNVDPDVSDSLIGGRPIHIAAARGRPYSAFLRLPAFYRKDNRIDHVGVIRALVEAGCNVMARTLRGRTALDMAKSANNRDIVRFLEDL